MMAATAAVIAYVPVEEYLHSSYHPDVDYVDGYLENRNMGENEHSDLQTYLATLLRMCNTEWRIYTYVEHRVQVNASRYRVPDICVMPGTWQRTPVISQPPLLCIEILSPEDTFSRTQAKCRDYLAMGVAEVWIFDPEERKAYVMREDRMTEQHDDMLRLEGTAVEISLSKVFSTLDE